MTVAQIGNATRGPPIPHPTDLDLKDPSILLPVKLSRLEIHANLILAAQTPNVPSKVTAPSVLVVPTPLVILTPTAKWIHANNSLVELMLNAKVQEVELFVNVLADSLEILLFGVMIILAIRILVELMPIVKITEIALYVDAAMDMKVYTSKTFQKMPNLTSFEI